MTPEEFVEKYRDKIVVSDDGCWLWQGYTNNRGYGMITLNDRKQLNHRVVMGDPDDKQVNHHCDVKRCCNPDHLYIGTQSENIQDAIDRGQIEDLSERLPSADGENNPSSKLTESDVRELRSRYSDGDITIKELATDYPISWPQVGAIVSGRSWDYAEAYPE